jgi:hypothetical protein
LLQHGRRRVRPVDRWLRRVDAKAPSRRQGGAGGGR